MWFRSCEKLLLGTWMKSHMILRVAWLKKTQLIHREKRVRMMQASLQKDTEERHLCLPFNHIPMAKVCTWSPGFPVAGPWETWLKFMPLDSVWWPIVLVAVSLVTSTRNTTQTCSSTKGLYWLTKLRCLTWMAQVLTQRYQGSLSPPLVSVFLWAGFIVRGTHQKAPWSSGLAIAIKKVPTFPVDLEKLRANAHWMV